MLSPPAFRIDARRIMDKPMMNATTGLAGIAHGEEGMGLMQHDDHDGW
jgi:hypothetical protein